MRVFGDIEHIHIGCLNRFLFVDKQRSVAEPICCGCCSQSGLGASLDSDPRFGNGVGEGGRMALDNKTSLLNTPSPRSFSSPRFRDYNPYNYTDTIGTLDKTPLKGVLFDDAPDGQ